MLLAVSGRNIAFVVVPGGNVSRVRFPRPPLALRRGARGLVSLTVLPTRARFGVCTGVCTIRALRAPQTNVGRMVEPNRPSHAPQKGAYGIRTSGPHLRNLERPGVWRLFSALA